MSVFTSKEIEHLQGQRLDRLATVNAGFGSELIRLTLMRIVSWGIDTDSYKPNSRSVDVPKESSTA